ncbi:DUF6644 family protein [Pseudoroseomonas cervicalis]|uniref:DUF6644 family protein n=1 Tax=Teichococcus cervicalis TaxID=204525 RepID=UPI0022F15B20|nr:DUF6644 family protein [Pseudoroseomonas cervicalis]WBV41895.1 DUF2214 domain-containing protein [Pseudoroseomonas cervicalis]
MEAALSLLADSALPAWLRRSGLGYPLVNAAHVLGLGLLLGSIATLDLRLLGAFRGAPLAVLAPPLLAVAKAGLVLAILSGALLFSVQPLAYAGNPAFLAKLFLVALGIVNALALRRRALWRQALDGGAVPPALKLAALISLAAWLGALLAGRWIGFL